MSQHPAHLAKVGKKQNNWFNASVDILKPAIDSKKKANFANKQRATRAISFFKKKKRLEKLHTVLSDRLQTNTVPTGPCR